MGEAAAAALTAAAAEGQNGLVFLYLPRWARDGGVRLPRAAVGGGGGAAVGAEVVAAAGIAVAPRSRGPRRGLEAGVEKRPGR